MLESLFQINQSPTSVDHAANQQHTKRVMTMVKNERMGGYVPKWETVLVEADKAASAAPANAQEQVEQQLTSAAQGINGDEQAPALASSDHAHAYAPIEGASLPLKDTKAHEPFGFGDLVDMVNPLQHIPLIGSAYREITGDQIKPIGYVVGGAIFGGPIGMASGIMNAVVQDSTGKSVEEHAKSVIFRKNKPESPAPAPMIAESVPEPQPDLPELPAVMREELPGTVISMADLKAPNPTTAEPKHDPQAIKDYLSAPRKPITDMFTVPDSYLMEAAKAGLKDERT